jgi:hypothetical protein
MTQAGFHPGRSVSPIHAHVLSEDLPLSGQDVPNGIWPPIDRYSLVRTVRDGDSMLMEHGGLVMKRKYR